MLARIHSMPNANPDVDGTSVVAMQAQDGGGIRYSTSLRKTFARWGIGVLGVANRTSFLCRLTGATPAHWMHCGLGRHT